MTKKTNTLLVPVTGRENMQEAMQYTFAEMLPKGTFFIFPMSPSFPYLLNQDVLQDVQQDRNLLFIIDIKKRNAARHLHVRGYLMSIN